MNADRSSSKSSDPVSMSHEEQLFRHFYSWEYLGRGWILYDFPVELEPPFRPFSWNVSAPPPAVDDGRRHTLLSRLVDRLSNGWSSPLSRPPASDPAEIKDPDPEVIEVPRSWVEIDVGVPATLKVNKDSWLRFIQSLRHSHSPMAFEIIGTMESINVQIVCRDEDWPQVYPQLEGHFPDCTFDDQTSGLEPLWSRMRSPCPVIVDFGLSHEFMVPLEAISAFDPDPLTSIVGAMGRLREEEVAVFQVIFQPLRKPWAESARISVTNWEGKSVFEDQSLIRLAEEKLRSPLYGVVVRVAATSQDQRRSWQVVRGLGGALAQFSRMDGNELIPLTNEDYLDEDHEVDLFDRRSHRCGMILNAEELASLAHLPSASVRSPKIRKKVDRTKAAPETAKGHSFILGENTHQRKTIQVSLSPEQRSRHMHVIGVSGKGKSTLLIRMIRQDMEQGNGFAVLDPHGDLIDQVIGHASKERLDDIILLDPSDEEFSVGFNILDAHSSVEKNLLASDLVDVFRRLSTSWGDQMTAVLRNAIQAFLESSEGGTLRDLRRFLVDKDFRTEFLRTVDDDDIRYYWRKEFPLLSGRPHASILTRLDVFFSSKFIKYMTAQRQSKLDFRSIMDTGKILLARLSEGAIGEGNGSLLGSLLVSKFHQTALSRQDQKEADRRPFYLYIDECHHFVTPSVSAILSGARKYKLGLVLAHQHCSQLGNSEVADAVLGTPCTRICFKPKDQDTRKLAEGFSFFNAADLLSLDPGEAIACIDRADNDFNLVVPLDPRPHEDRLNWNREYVTTRTHNLYCRPRVEIAREIAREFDEDEEEVFANESEPKLRRKKKSDEPNPEPNPSPSKQLPTESVESALSTDPPPKPVPPIPCFPEKPDVYVPKPPPTPGMGGRDHKYIQETIKLRALKCGFRVDIEDNLKPGGRVDVALELAGHRIACEISVTTSSGHEMGNIRKCLSDGFNEVILVVADPKRLSRMKNSIEETFTATERERVDCMDQSGILMHIEEIAAGQKVQTGKAFGRDFKAKESAVSDSKKERAKKTILENIAKSELRRIRRKKDQE